MNRISQLSFMLLLAVFSFTACESETVDRRVTSIPKEDLSLRYRTSLPADSLISGSSYLSSYSVIYARSAEQKFSLTGTVSLRNINLKDTVYLDQADYYNTEGELVRSYFDQPIYLAPLETVHIVLTDSDVEGGMGDNFVFHWYKSPGSHDPLFEGLFVTVYGQQGISFTTQGVRIK